MKLEKEIRMISDEIRKARPGVPVFLADLRKRLPEMKRDDFNQAVLTMAGNGYFLTRHFHPAQATDAEKELMIPDGAGNFYIAINPREDAAEAIEEAEPLLEPDEPERSVRNARGGHRSGAGRPAKKLKEKRLPLTGVRLPGWLLDWLQSQGDVGKSIEKAVVLYYDLTPPGQNDGPCCSDPGPDKG